MVEVMELELQVEVREVGVAKEAVAGAAAVTVVAAMGKVA